MNGSEDTIPVQKLRVLQIIAASLLIGLVGFLVVVLIISQGEPPTDSFVVSFVAAGMLGADGLLALVLPGVLADKSLRSIAAGSWQPPPGTAPSEFAPDAAKLWMVRQTTLIVALALFEGAGFMGCVAYLVERQWFTLGIVGVAILFIVSNFPTASGVRNWLDRQLGRLQDLRQGGEVSPL
jgi:hypothetical protein